ncbi:MAG: hypothetical protein ACF8R9_05565 [Phycisphaerales bacterium JB054]
MSDEPESARSDEERLEDLRAIASREAWRVARRRLIPWLCAVPAAILFLVAAFVVTPWLLVILPIAAISYCVIALLDA